MSTDEKKRERWYRLAILLLALSLLGSVGYLVWKDLDYQKGAADYAEAEEAAAVPRLEETPVPRQEETSVPEQGEEPVPDPNIDLLAGVALGSLREVNGDVLGWIIIPDTGLSYPLLQCGDNQYYLNHTWLNERSSVGAIFMECRCTSDFSDFNTIIYGHRMKNGSMFGVLRNYKKVDFWREHPTVYVVADSGVRVYDIYAALEAGTQEIIYHLNIEEQEEKQEFIDFGLKHSEIDTGIVPTTGDQILTLSTCTGRGHATRWIIQAVLVQTYPFPGTE